MSFGGGSGGPLVSLPTLPDCSGRGQLRTSFSCPGAIPSEPERPSRKMAEASGPSPPPPPAVPCQTQGFPSAARGRPDPLPRRFLPLAPGWRWPSFCAPSRRAPAGEHRVSGVRAAALLPGCEFWDSRSPSASIRPPAGGRDPRPPHSPTAERCPETPRPATGGAGTEPGPTGAGQGRLPRKGSELGERMSQRV